MSHPELYRIAEVLDAKDREIVTLRAALAWYAEPSNWRREVRNVGPRINWTNSPAATDRGGRAKLTLLALEGMR